MIKRRQFLLGAAGVVGAAGALVVGWSLLPQRQRLLSSKPLPVDPGQVALNGWVKIASDGVVTVVMAHSEMGQGSHTGLAMLLADELDAAWEQVRIEQSTLDKIYNNVAAITDSLPFRPEDQSLFRRGATHLVRKLVREMPGIIVTGGSASVKDLWLPMREAGASARALLINAAAELWNVPAAQCTADQGRVTHASGKNASFGELVHRAASLPLPSDIRLKAPADFKLIGKPIRRIDAAAKLNGSAQFGIDVLPPGLLYASVVMCPTIGGQVASFNAGEALAMPGVQRIVKLPPWPPGSGRGESAAGGIAVIANQPFRAMQAAQAVAVEWDHGPAAQFSSQAFVEQLSRATRADAGRTYYETGDVDKATAARTIAAEYRVPYLAHATMEPMNCTVQFKDGRAKVWIPTQMPSPAIGAIAGALGIEPENVELKITYLGGGFGRRTFPDFAAQAAVVAREANGAPVQTLWSREQDMTHDFYRPAVAARCIAGFDDSGRLLSWRVTSAAQGMGAPSFLDASMDGAWNTAYEFANSRFDHTIVAAPIPIGIWRAVNNSQNAFFTESFMDEVATTAGNDPLQFRKSLLRNSPRHLRVLERVEALSRWNDPLPAAADGAQQARGLAIHRCFGSIVAQVAEVSVSSQGEIRVHRVVCVIDCGMALNPNLIRQQLEGGIVFGLSAALHGEITIENGRARQSNFHDYAPLRMHECPEIETDIIASTEPPGGVGEPGTPPIAPAVANALFALTGQRLRTLPLRLA